MRKFNSVMKAEWETILSPFLFSEEFRKIEVGLKKDYKYLTPDPNNIFRAFKETDPLTMHTLILGQDPYPGMTQQQLPVADGLAFSSQNSPTCPKALETILRAIDESVYMNWGYHLTDSYDLSRWANNGILLLNCALTTRLGSSGTHFALWEPFTVYVMEQINKRFDNLGIILMGSEARRYKQLLTNPTYYIQEISHPSSASYRGEKWDHKNCFKNLQDYHIKNKINLIW
jgi:uracil-DNA glycosylase